jgi:prevent-host-death family protein
MPMLTVRLSLVEKNTIVHTPWKLGANAMTKTLSLKEAGRQFSAIVGRVGRLWERVIVTKNGTPKAVLMSAEEFESWVETMEFLSNPKAVKALKQGLKEAKAGKVVSFKDAFGENQ